jgi:radical SAM/Cys-rich protein
MNPHNDFDGTIINAIGSPLTAHSLDTMQINMGLQCNHRCKHCHVEATPQRTEMMDEKIMSCIIEVVCDLKLQLIDITGGAPELHPLLRSFIRTLRIQGHIVQVRTNLTVLLEAKMRELLEFYRSNAVKLVASLPCYERNTVDYQRGTGVFEKSIESLIALNQIGYGSIPELTLDLVYNPDGPFLPPDQSQLESEYRAILNNKFGIVFNNLHTITNMPIGRFLQMLRQTGTEAGYHKLLRDSFNPDTLEGLMCRHQICVDWTGTLYDCDFNLALRQSIQSSIAPRIQHFDADELAARLITTGNHCFGCTAGQGSSCQGALLHELARALNDGKGSYNN